MHTSFDMHEFATRYTAAWCSQDAASVAAFFKPNGSLTIDDGPPSVGRAAITTAAREFMTAFPDLKVTMDSVSMVSEAVATAAPVMLARLPGRSRRSSLFTEVLLHEGRVREFAGRLELWPVSPLDDTAEAAAEMCRRLGLPHPETPC